MLQRTTSINLNGDKKRVFSFFRQDIDPSAQMVSQRYYVILPGA